MQGSGQDMTIEGGISGFGLKLIALVTMLIDHTGAVVLWQMLSVPGTDPGRYSSLIRIYDIMRYIGRMAFPIYCFLLVQGFLHTRSRAKYALRLLIFALISEVPFDLAIFDTAFDWQHQNVFFTLLLGLLALWALHEIGRRMQEGLGAVMGKLMVFAAVIAAALAAEFVLHSDYGACGVLAVVIMYCMSDRNPTVGYVIAVILLAAGLNLTELFALAVAPIVWAYNGSRGRQMKYVFYAFYPLHLLILAGLCAVCGF